MSENLLELPDQELKEKIWSELGLNKERIKEAVENLKDWLHQQPHLPNDDDDVRLERFLLNCKNSMEITKMTLDLYYTLKSMSPDLMTGWDPQGDWFQEISKAVQLYPAPKLTPVGDRILVMQFATTDATNFDHANYCKALFLFLEIRTSEDYWRSNIIVLDFKKITIAHISKIGLPTARKCEVILMKGYKCRVKAVHIINVPPFADVLINMLKSVFKNKLATRFHVHGSDLTEFYKQVPKHLLPSDFGGDGESMATQYALWKKKIELSRDWLLERESMKSDEKRRPGKVVESGEIFGFEGSFRKLNVD